MNIKRLSSNYRILDSGSVMTFDSTAELTFDIKMDDSFSFTLIFRFESTDDGKQKLKNSVDGSVITLSCINWNNSLGTGTTHPIELAKFNGKKIYVNFWVYALASNSLHNIMYTFYSES